jgi:hypothetical protein
MLAPKFGCPVLMQENSGGIEAPGLPEIYVYGFLIGQVNDLLLKSSCGYLAFILIACFLLVETL